VVLASLKEDGGTLKKRTSAILPLLGIVLKKKNRAPYKICSATSTFSRERTVSIGLMIVAVSEPANSSPTAILSSVGHYLEIK
jgi:hypothetical protein